MLSFDNFNNSPHFLFSVPLVNGYAYVYFVSAMDGKMNPIM